MFFVLPAENYYENQENVTIQQQRIMSFKLFNMKCQLNKETLTISIIRFRVVMYDNGCQLLDIFLHTFLVTFAHFMLFHACMHVCMTLKDNFVGKQFVNFLQSYCVQWLAKKKEEKKNGNTYPEEDLKALQSSLG